jgi:hypothetical protein
MKPMNSGTTTLGPLLRFLKSHVLP